ncbi:conserved hypothetical protein [Metallosphaera cuprina Ar-4]|uniref:Uncharacterized protein n=2 Tax=Metallosphaera TaxID=41980 RepID=F4G2S0_METCR|nr:conserved hypothetical protein [Metallosphaera cuprina Ar-4]
MRIGLFFEIFAAIVGYLASNLWLNLVTGLLVSLSFSGSALVTLNQFIYPIIITTIQIVLALIAYLKMKGLFSELEMTTRDMSLAKIGLLLAIFPLVMYIGYILIAAGLYSIGEKYGSDFNKNVMRIGSLITGIPLLNFVGLIFNYIAIGSIVPFVPPVKQYRPPINVPPYQWQPGYQPGYPYYQSYQPVQVYQMGQGVLKGNVAMLSLFSTGQLRINRASLEGFNTFAIRIEPLVVVPGKNDIKVEFPETLQGLTKGSTYRLKIELEANVTVYANLINE